MSTSEIASRSYSGVMPDDEDGPGEQIPLFRHIVDATARDNRLASAQAAAERLDVPPQQHRGGAE